MQSKYFFSLFFLLLLIVGQAEAQNIPNGQTAPSGTVTTTIPVPDEVNTAIDPNYIATYVPVLPITSFATPPAYSPPSQVRQAIEYKDGFNRTFQAVQPYVSWTGGQARHLVQLYDNRFRKEQYSFLPYSSTSNGIQGSAFQAQKDYYQNKYPDEGYTSYGHTRNTSNDTARSAVTYLPGKSQTGQNRGTVTRKITNVANQVRIWTLDGSGLPISTSWYASGELFGEEVVLPGADGNINAASPASRVFTDKEGRVVLKMMADSNYVTTGGVPQTWITYQRTYYVYNDMGRLVYILSPRAVELIEANNWVVTTDILGHLCFYNDYDGKGQKIASRTPGKATEVFVYDNLGRAVLYQNDLLKAQNKWQFTIYDAQSRAVCAGLYQEVGATGQTLQARFIDGQNYTGLFGYLKNYNLRFDYPTTIAASEIQSYNYYDNYTYSDPGDALWATFSTNSLGVSELQSTTGSETPVRSPRIQGRLTGSKVKILASPNAQAAKTGDWRQSAVYYDDKGRVIYTAGRDLYQNNSIHTDYTASQYDFISRLLISKHIHSNTNAAAGATQHTEWTKNQYDPNTQKLLNGKHKVDNGNWNIISSFTYDDMGQVQRKILGNGGEVQDFTYNIRGQLAGINGDYALTSAKGGVSRSFGEALNYDYGFNQVRYDGRIAGIIWRGSSADMTMGGPLTASRSHAYGYDYDQSGRLKRADYRMQSNLGGITQPWSNTDMDFSVANLFYDKNGNILSMKQRGTKPGTGPVDMDVFSYRYDNNNKSNRLLAVTDAGVADYGAGDFHDGSNGLNNDYSYDNNGNLASDANKSISGAAYYYFDKPYSVSLGGGKLIEYSYDATGNKVQELVINPGQSSKRTDYLGNFIYQGDSLQYVLTGEGRTIVTPTPGNDSTKEEYFVKDHLGNVRSTIDVVTYLTRNYLATWEIASANLEGLIFDNLNEVRDTKPGSTDPNDASSGRLNGAETDHRVGASLLMRVMAGDKISLQVNNYFEQYNANDDSPVSTPDMLASLVSTLAGGQGGFPGEEHNTKLVNDLFSEGNFNSFQGAVTENYTDPAKPKAYLNYVFFDDHMKIVTQLSGAFQANGDGTWATIGTQAPMEIPMNGYMGVYLSNSSSMLSCGSCGNVFFDQLWVEVSKGNLLEETHYYPHGLPISGLSGQTADDFKDQRRRYQGNEYIKDLGLNWMDFQARQYDPQIGRFLGVDPMATSEGQERYSPYSAMGGQPESQVDPNGTVAMGAITFSTNAPMYTEGTQGNDAMIGRAMQWAMTGGLVGSGSGGGGGNWGSDAASTMSAAEFWHAIKFTIMLTAGNTTIYENGQFNCNFGVDGKLNLFNSSGGDQKGSTKKKKDLFRVELSPHLKYTGTTGGEMNGATIDIWYDGDLSGYSKLNWIQTYWTTNSPNQDDKNGVRRPDGEDKPFYYSYSRIDVEKTFGGVSEKERHFQDNPGRSSSFDNYSWEAEVSLVGYKNGAYHNIITFRWGYIIPAPNVIVPYWRQEGPSPEQLKAIQNAK